MLGGALLRGRRLDEARPALRLALRHFHAASDAAGIALVFDDLHSQAVADGDVERAARIYGAARRLTAATGVHLATFVDEAYTARSMPNIGDRLAPAERERLGAEGAAMTLDEAVAYALDVPVADLVRGADEPA
jgi:serine/threonine-protein kinase PknK